MLLYLKRPLFFRLILFSSSSRCFYVYDTETERLVHLGTDLIGLFDKRQGSDETNVVNLIWYSRITNYNYDA